ncbi:response regulator [Streptomyces sp. NPDC126514]|uniref:response regulator n=1 Tax=Streptomyces sp. NPDC126514 TaxID=3155210 RepID=UPI00331E2EB8
MKRSLRWPQDIRISLRSFMRAFIIANAVLLTIVLTLSVLAVNSMQEATRSQSRRSDSLKLAYELRQTSDDLTRMARTYVITGEPRFRSYFKEIAAIRDGSAPRPEHYDRIYWDVVTDTGRRPSAFGPPVSFDSLVARAGFTTEELGLLRTARSRSDGLILLEDRAFATMEGSATRASRNQAAALLNGPEYHHAKAQIMEPIGRVFELVDQRTQGDAAVATRRATAFSTVAIGAAILMICWNVAGGTLGRRSILRPIRLLDEATTRIADGDLDAHARVEGASEIRVLAARFNGMAGRVRRRTGELELLRHVAVTANEAADLEQAAQVVLDLVCDYTGWQVGHAYWLSPAARDSGVELVPSQVWHGEDSVEFRVFRRATEAAPMAPGRGLPGRTLISGKPVWIADVTKDLNFPRAAEAGGLGLRAGMGFPVLVGNEVVAVLEFFSRRSAEPDEALLDLMAHVGTQLGRVVDRVRGQTAARNVALLLESTAEGIYATDLNGECTFANKAAAKMLGYEAEELVGRDMHQICGHSRSDGRPYSSAECSICAAYRTGSGCHAQGDIFRRRNGTAFPVAYTSYPISQNESTHGAVVTFSDVTAQRRVEEALQQARDVAESASQAKSAFLAAMSHEIRTPMNAVVGMTDLLLETPLTKEQRNFVRIVQDSADSLLRVINDILDFSKFEAGKFTLERMPVNLRECIESAFDVIAAKAREKPDINLAYYVDRDVPNEIMGDGLRLRQIMNNLLGNAIKFTESGEIVLTAARLEPQQANGGHDGAPQTSAADHDGLTVHFAVRDTGIGIPRHRIEHLFQPFEQLDASTTRRFGGTGLGLAISQRLTELMGGTIWVESEIGVGSTFHFIITTQEVPEELRTRQVMPPTDLLRGMRMLAVDDNPTNRMILTRQADAWGMHVRCTGSPMEALAWIRAGDPFDVAVLDMQMSGMDGLALGREISRYRDPHALPMVLLTSLGRPEGRPEDLSRFFTYHVKPIKAVQLYGSLCQALVSAETEPAEPIPASSAASRGLPPLRILLAEDNTINQELALRMLSKIGYAADAVSDGAQAVEALRQRHYDVILMDVHMPVMNGLEASKAIHHEWPPGRRPRIIALTASAMREDREACTDVGMDDFLSKPIHMSMLADALARSATVHGPSRGAVDYAPPSGTAVPATRVCNQAVLQKLIDSLDDAFVKHLVDVFLENSPHLIANIRQGMDDNDPELVRRAAHTLKSNSATFGLDQLAPLCSDLEKFAATGALAAARTLATDVEAAYQPARAALQGFRAKFDQGEATRD